MSDDATKPPEGQKVATDPTLPAGTPVPGSAPSPGVAETVRSGPLPSDEDKLVGKRLSDRYTVLGRLGAGGMSVVYLARHEQLNKIVAVKLLRQEIAGSAMSMARFKNEAMAAAAIGDPHIVDVYDFFTEGGESFLVMERLEGRDLRQALASTGALALGRAVSITRQILRALRAAHARGIVHRDLKAENVFLTERDGTEFVKLLDFGISKLLQPLEGSGLGVATSTGVVMGTPQYIAPEQAHGQRDVDHRVDIYSLGVILYEMLTGSLPFTGSSALAVLMKHVQEEPQPPRQRRPDRDIPVELEQVVLKALAKDPSRRYQSAEEMLTALPDPLALPGGYGSGALPSTLPTGPGAPVPASPQPQGWWPALLRRPALLAALGVVAVGGSALILHFLYDHLGWGKPSEGSSAARPDARASRLGTGKGAHVVAPPGSRPSPLRGSPPRTASAPASQPGTMTVKVISKHSKVSKVTHKHQPAPKKKTAPKSDLKKNDLKEMPKNLGDQ
jgi:eukaryotic-like serine/threonine-protein kinase